MYSVRSVVCHVFTKANWPRLRFTLQPSMPLPYRIEFLGKWQVSLILIRNPERLRGLTMLHYVWTVIPAATAVNTEAWESEWTTFINSCTSSLDSYYCSFSPSSRKPHFLNLRSWLNGPFVSNRRGDVIGQDFGLQPQQSGQNKVRKRRDLSLFGSRSLMNEYQSYVCRGLHNRLSKDEFVWGRYAQGRRLLHPYMILIDEVQPHSLTTWDLFFQCPRARR